MYKVFINEKKLSIHHTPLDGEKNVAYEGKHSLEMAIDILENTSASGVCVFSNDVEEIWKDFKSLFKIVEAAGGVVRNLEGKILFIYRLNRWDLPKGKIEPNETYENAAVREVEEETKLTNLILGDAIFTTYHMYNERDTTKVLKMTHWFNMKYEGNETPIPQTEEGITDVQWIDSHGIKTMVIPHTFQNIRLILENGVSI